MNTIAILVAIILNIIIGSVWYSALFGKRWANALGLSYDDCKPSLVHFLGAVIVAAVSVIVTAILINLFQISAVMDAIRFAVLIWLGFIATNYFSGVIWAKKPMLVYLIDVGCLLVTTLVNTILLTLWR